MQEVHKNPFFKLMDCIASCMKPVIPVLLAGGLLKLVILVIGYIGVFQFLGDTEVILTAISDAPFYFLPFMVAYASSLHFKTNPLYGMVSVAVLLLPNFITLMESDAPLHLFGLPVYKASYAYSVLPVILLIYISAKIGALFNRIIPGAAHDILHPLLTIFCTAVLGILLVGPAGAFFSHYLSMGMTYLQTGFPIVAWALFSAITPLLVITGMHWVFTALAIAQLGEFGVECGYMVSFFFLSMTATAATIVVFLKSKSAQTKQVALSAGITCFFTGTSEPSLYGIMLPFKTPLVAAMIGGAAAGAIQGMLAIKCYVYAFPGILSVLMFSSPSNPQNLLYLLIAGGVAFICSLIVNWILFRDKAL